MGFIRVLLSSPKRIAQFTFVFLAILAVPITLTLVKERQDLRQRASEPIPVNSTDYNSDGNISGKEGYNAVFDPTQGGWIYVPVDSTTGEQLPYTAPETQPDTSCGQPCSGDGACGGGTICQNGCCTAGLLRCGDKTCDSATQDCATGGARFSETMCITKGTCVQNFNCFSPNICMGNTCTSSSGTSTSTTTSTTTSDTTQTTNDVTDKTDGTNSSSDQMKITLKKNGSPLSNISLTLDTVLKTRTSSVVRTESQTTDSSGIATFARPDSISTSTCRTYSLSIYVCYYFDNYFSRYFSYIVKINTPNIVFNSNNTQSYSITNHGDITLDVLDNSPTATTTYRCDFDGRNGPDLLDYTVWLGEFRASQKDKADCDNNNIIDIFDYAMWLGEFRAKNATQ